MTDAIGGLFGAIRFFLKQFHSPYTAFHSTRSSIAISFLAFAFLFFPIALAQNTPDPGVIQAFSSIEPHEYDSINLATLAIQLNVPVRSKAGHIPFSFALSGTAWVRISTRAGKDGPVLWLNGFPTLTGQESHIGTWEVSGVSAATMLTCGVYGRFGDWLYTDALGNPHPFAIAGVSFLSGNSACAQTSGSGYTTDGSGYIKITIRALNAKH